MVPIHATTVYAGLTVNGRRQYMALFCKPGFRFCWFRMVTTGRTIGQAVFERSHPATDFCLFLILFQLENMSPKVLTTLI